MKAPLTLPPAVARSFVRDMRAFFAEENATKRDVIAVRQLHSLKEHQGPREKPLGGPRSGATKGTLTWRGVEENRSPTSCERIGKHESVDGDPARVRRHQSPARGIDTRSLEQAGCERQETLTPPPVAPSPYARGRRYRRADRTPRPRACATRPIWYVHSPLPNAA